MKNIRSAQVAGYFYTADPNKLRNEINLLLNIPGKEKRIEKIFGIVSPHAGYAYSGKTAAYSYNQLIGKTYKRVVIISPSHSEYFPGISIFNGDAYQTPFGILEVDKDFSAKLSDKSKNIFFSDAGHHKEHALEVQLPFLQTVLKDFKIVPLVMGDQNTIYVDELAKRMNALNNNQLVSPAVLQKTIDRYDMQIDRGPGLFNDEQLLRISHLRSYRG